MAPQKDLGDISPNHPPDTDVDFAGYDPYIVAITAADHSDAASNAADASGETTESRKAKLMTWLREHGA